MTFASWSWTISPRLVDWPVPIRTFALLVPIVAALWWTFRHYRHESDDVPSWGRRWMLLLRSLALGLAWTLFAIRPGCVAESPAPAPTIRFAFDVSKSMTAGGDDSRLSSAQSWFATSGRRLLASDEAVRWEAMAFGRSAWQVDVHSDRWNLSGHDADALAGTDLVQALQASGDERAIILATDGRHNASSSPVEAAKKLGDQGVAVFPLIFADRGAGDALIARLDAPTRVLRNSVAPVAVSVRLQGLAKGKYHVELRIDGKEFQPDRPQFITHDGVDRASVVSFDPSFDAPGVKKLEARVVGPGPEASLENNVRSTVVQVVAEKPRVLIIDQDARWETRYLADALRRDPALAVDVVLLDQPRIGALDAEQTKKAGLPALDLPRLVPGKPDPMFDIGCIILGDVEPEKLTLDFRQRLERFVSDRAGVLVVSAGKRSMPKAYLGPDKAGDPLARLLPIHHPETIKTKDGFQLDRVASASVPWMADSQPAWPTTTCHYWGVAGVPRLGASTLARPADLKAGDDSGLNRDQASLLALHRYGMGRVVYIGIDSTWRWRERAGDEPVHRFWGSLVRWSLADSLLPAGNRLVRFGPTRPIFQSNDPVRVTARLSPEIEPITGGISAKVHALDSPAGAVSLTLSPHAWQPGVWEGDAPGLTPGTYRLEIDDIRLRKALAEKTDAATPAADRFVVSPAEDIEMQDLTVDRGLLEAIAERSGGAVATPETIEESLNAWLSRQPRNTGRTEVRWDRDLPWAAWSLGILTSLLAGEWLLRRRLGLT